MTSGQEKVRLDAAIRIFCHGTDQEEVHRKACGRYLQLRHKAAGETLVEKGDLEGLRVCLKEDWFSEKEREALISLGIQRGQTDCLGALLTGGVPEGEFPESRGPLWQRILQLVGRSLDRDWPYLGQAFHLLTPEKSENISGAGSDGFTYFVEEKALLEDFAREEGCERDVAHTLAHLLLYHPVQGMEGREQRLWNLCCDTIAEWTLERKLGYTRNLSQEEREKRQVFYGWLEGKRIGTAAELYRYGQEEAAGELSEAADLFACDDHRPWYESKKTAESWRQQLRRFSAITQGGEGVGEKGGIRGSGGSGVQKYREPQASEYDYKELLEGYMTAGEELLLDQENFDTILYTYSREHYQGPVLLEPLETSEVRRLSEIVIAIDTSGSCSGDIVQQFLKETFSILEKKEHFFRRMRVHILQCDSMIQDERLIEKEEDWKDYRQRIKIRGLGNTDFRPVFSWIEEKRKTGDIRDLKGLIYFTDGDGIYPREAPDYETAFVYLNDKLMKGKTPGYIKKVNLQMDRSFETLFDDEREGRFGRRGTP